MESRASTTYATTRLATYADVNCLAGLTHSGTNARPFQFAQDYLSVLKWRTRELIMVRLAIWATVRSCGRRVWIWWLASNRVDYGGLTTFPVRVSLHHDGSSA